MKAKNFILGLCAFGMATAALVSCTQKEFDGVVVGGPDVEISFTSSVDGGTVTKSVGTPQALGESGLCLTVSVSENNTDPLGSVATRAYEVTGFGAEAGEGVYDSFGVTAYMYSGDWTEQKSAAEVYIDNKPVSCYNGVWTFEEKTYWPSEYENLAFFAYAPVSVGDMLKVSDGTDGYIADTPTPYISYSDPALSGSGDVFDGDRQYDLLVAKNLDAQSTSTNKFSLNFSHALTAVRFVCGEIPDGKITNVTIGGLAYSGTYDIEGGKWTVDEEAADYDISLSVDAGNGQGILTGGATLMMVPQTLEDVPLTITFEDGETSDVTTLTATLSGEWAAGDEVTYTISHVVAVPTNYDEYTNGGGITIGDKTYTADEYGEATLISSSNSSFAPAASGGVYFIEPGAEVTYTGTANLSKLILIGNDPTQKSKVSTTGSTQVKLSANAELVFSNLDLDFSGETSYPIVLNADGAVERLAFVGCHVTAGSSNNTAIAYTSSTARYFNEILISDCVWNMPASSSTEYLVQIAEGNTNTQESFTLTNNVFYSSGTESDFRIVMAKGMTFTDVVYKNNTLVNLAASANGVFEYGSITNVDAEWNLTYDESLTAHYVFFRPSGDSAVPTGTVTVENNIAYRGSDTTYGWYWFYGEENAETWAEVAPEGFNACEVITADPFSGGTLDLTNEIFTPNSTYSGYGYQSN